MENEDNTPQWQVISEEEAPAKYEVIGEEDPPDVDSFMREQRKKSSGDIFDQITRESSAAINKAMSLPVTRNPILRLPVSYPFQPMKRTRNKKTGAITEDWSTDGSIGGDAVREVAVAYLPPGFVDDLSKTNKLLEVNGTYEYCDELGRYACRTFSLTYQQVPFGSFRIMRDNECIDRSWLGNTNAGPDEEILPVCVQRNAPPFPNK